MSSVINPTAIIRATNTYAANQTGNTSSAVAQAPETKTPNVDTFTMENASLINIADARSRDGYYHHLFWADTASVNKVFCDGQGSYGTFNSRTVESALSRYQELREEITKTFGGNSQLLSQNLSSLDTALERQLTDIAREAADVAEGERMAAEAHQKQREQGIKVEYEPHKLATNKDFNKTDFEANAKNLMSNLAKTFVQKINSGLDYAAAQKSTFQFMMDAFSKTTSVNNLSFNDFMVFHKYCFADESTATRANNLAVKSELNKSFNNSSELSAELRALLG